MSKDNLRLILCRNCSSFMQAPNPEMGTCKIEEDTVRYDSPCLFGISEKVEVPEIETQNVEEKT